MGPGSTLEAIERAESSLNVIFPPDYRTFLSTFSYGGIDGIEIMGVDAEWAEGLSPDVVAVNQEARKEGLPSNILLIEEMGDGACYAIDLRRGPAHGQVVVWPLIDGDINDLEVTHSDFGDYLLERIGLSIST